MSGYTSGHPSLYRQDLKKGREPPSVTWRVSPGPRLPKVLRSHSVSRGGAGCECGGA